MAVTRWRPCRRRGAHRVGDHGPVRAVARLVLVPGRGDVVSVLLGATPVRMRCVAKSAVPIEPPAPMTRLPAGQAAVTDFSAVGVGQALRGDDLLAGDRGRADPLRLERPVLDRRGRVGHGGDAPLFALPKAGPELLDAHAAEAAGDVAAHAGGQLPRRARALEAGAAAGARAGRSTVPSSVVEAQIAYAVRLQFALLPVPSSAAAMFALVSGVSGNRASSTTWPLGLLIVPSRPITDFPAGQVAVDDLRGSWSRGPGGRDALQPGDLRGADRVRRDAPVLRRAGALVLERVDRDVREPGVRHQPVEQHLAGRAGDLRAAPSSSLPAGQVATTLLLAEWTGSWRSRAPARSAPARR